MRDLAELALHGRRRLRHATLDHGARGRDNAASVLQSRVLQNTRKHECVSMVTKIALAAKTGYIAARRWSQLMLAAFRLSVSGWPRKFEEGNR